MGSVEDIGRISVSRDALRAELAQMELRLVDKLATQVDVDALEARVTKTEDALARIKGALALLSVAAAVLGGLLVKLVTS